MFWNDIEEIKEGIDRLDIRISVISESVDRLLKFVKEPVCIPMRCDGSQVLDAGLEDIKEFIEFSFVKAINEIKEKKSPKKKKMAKKKSPIFSGNN